MIKEIDAPLWIKIIFVVGLVVLVGYDLIKEGVDHVLGRHEYA